MTTPSIQFMRVLVGKQGWDADGRHVVKIISDAHLSIKDPS